MRMRKKPNLIPRMEKCSAVQIKEPVALFGGWKSEFSEYKQLWLEIGCGKGRFTLDTAKENPECMLIAVEKVEDAMVIAMERVVEADAKNVRFISIDALKLREMFSPGEVDRIFINFCDPWPKSRDAKQRLTAPSFLRLYADALPVGGQIHFKTDNTPLFDWSIGRFTEEGWTLSEVTHDLHQNGIVGVVTDYEAKFVAEGMKINRLVATRTEKTLTTAAGVPERLRNSSLTDARGYEQSVEVNARKEAK